MPVFLNPVAFYALGAIAFLLAIYWFRRRARTVKVSSLIFWQVSRTPAEGGHKAMVNRPPMFFWLELLIIILLVASAAAPRMILGNRLMPLAIILDDSISMQAGVGKTPRQAAKEFITSEILAKDLFRVTLITCRARPEIVGQRDMSAGEALRNLEHWRCKSMISDVDAAITYAQQTISDASMIVVVTDRAPPESVGGNIAWHSFGNPMANMAITGANRYASANVDRCYFEFANFATQTARLQARIFNPANNQPYHQVDLKLRAGARHRVRFNLSQVDQTVEAQIINDVIAFDNRAWLLPVRKRPVRVNTVIASELLEDRLRTALESTGISVLSDNEPELIISDSHIVSPMAFSMRFLIASEPRIIPDNIYVSKGHPLTEGLPAVKGRWAVDPHFSSKGFPLISSDNLALVAIAEDGRAYPQITMNMTPEYSAIIDTVFWPVFFHNLLNYVITARPGPRDSNYRLSTKVEVKGGRAAVSATMVSPVNIETVQPLSRSQTVFELEEAGIHQLHIGNKTWSIAGNPIMPQESDLRQRWLYSSPVDLLSGDFINYSSDIRWWFLLPALLLLLLHQWLLSNRRDTHVY